MLQSQEKPLDRLLRYSPWTAAALVAICFVALVARVAMYTGASDRPNLAAAAEMEQRTEAKTGGLESSRPGGNVGAVRSRTEELTALEGRSTSESTGFNGRRTKNVERKLKEPPTPSSKSRLRIHTAPGESAPDRTAPANRSPGSSGASAATLQAIPQQSRSASLDGRVHTSFFGLEAYGRRFVYVLDRSGSMGDPDNKPLDAAKRELLTSLARLGDIHQFFIIFYNEEPAVFNPGGASRQAVFADELTKESARRFVERVSAYGGTRHYEALTKAIALRPDVIFLLTDGEPKDDLSGEELARLRRSNGGLTQIHVVQFANAAYDGNSLVQLAAENRGQHTYKSLLEITGTARPGR
jgi:hypothetical protein